MPRPVTSWIYLGSCRDACWGLQGVIGLAGEVSALGLVLKQAEVAGAVGPSLLSGNQVGQASVLCPCPWLVTCTFPWTVEISHSSSGDHPSEIPVGSAGPSLVPTQWSLLQKFPEQQPHRALDLLPRGCCGSLGLCPSREEALARRRWWPTRWPNQLGGGCKNCSRFTLMCK